MQLPSKPVHSRGWLILLAVFVLHLSTHAGPVPALAGQSVVLKNDDRSLLVSLRSPRFIFDLGEAGDTPPAKISGSLHRGQTLQVSFPEIALGQEGRLEIKLVLQWSPEENVLRKWAEFRLLAASAPALLKEVVLEEVELRGEQPQLEGSGAQSYPAFWNGFFAGIEFPVAATHVEGNRVIVAHRPGLALRNGEWHQSRKAVFGLAPPGRERKNFARYIAAHRPKPGGLHLNYNSWWTSPAPFYKESDILSLMEQFEQNLYKPYGVSFDTFCIDMGWANPRTVWEINPTLFPTGFSKIQQGAERSGAKLGLWISPSAMYHDALNPDWARTNVETCQLRPGSPQICCLGGPRYASGFARQLTNLVTRYHIRHVKLDGYALECPETSHGHAPGPLASETIAEGGIAAFRAVRHAAPDVWLESTCFGFNPSPWWLFHVNSVIGTFGDDAPHGRVPAPVHRESYTTARDYFNLQGAARLPIPIVAQEVLGIVHQTSDSFLNDAVMTIARGHAFLPLYVNPAYLDKARWNALAQTLKWARQNAGLLEETVPILPLSWRNGAIPRFSARETMPREPYGYAHWKNRRGLVALRNPWVAPQKMALQLDESLGMERTARNLEVISLYPERRLYSSRAVFGDQVQIPLAPYETVLLSFAPAQRGKQLPKASELLNGHMAIRNLKSELTRLQYEEGPALGPDWTSLSPEGASAIQWHAEAELTLTTPVNQFLLLLEGKKPVVSPAGTKLLVDGNETVQTFISSEAGWSATGDARPEHWLFVQANLPPGHHRLTVEFVTGDELVRMSAWVWAMKPREPGDNRGAGFPNSLPSPETLSLDAQPLLQPVEPESVAPVLRCKRSTEKINGVFLDALAPASSVQGWGHLQRNQSVWEKPMTIAGRRFRRGLGTHADSRIVYDLGGRFCRFQTWVGADGASSATITFEVWTDGQKRWASDLMTRKTPAQFVDLDIAGARTLELVVGHGTDNFNSDHANWAEAKILR